MLYLHGGGMIAGSVAIFDGPVSRYVARTGVSMLSLEYRLAPEHPHPTPVEDAYAGLVWLVGHAAELGIDPGRIAVMGDSAGGGLAAGVAILSRDRKGPAVARQLLVYPMLDDRTTPDRYIAPFAGWSYDDNATGWNALLGPGHQHREVDPPAAPGRLGDAAGLPPAYIEVGQLDIFRDEDAPGALRGAGAPAAHPRDTAIRPVNLVASRPDAGPAEGHREVRASSGHGHSGVRRKVHRVGRRGYPDLNLVGTGEARGSSSERDQSGPPNAPVMPARVVRTFGVPAVTMWRPLALRGGLESALDGQVVLDDVVPGDEPAGDGEVEHERHCCISGSVRMTGRADVADLLIRWPS